MPLSLRATARLSGMVSPHLFVRFDYSGTGDSDIRKHDRWQLVTLGAITLGWLEYIALKDPGDSDADGRTERRPAREVTSSDGLAPVLQATANGLGTAPVRQCGTESREGSP